MRNGDVSDRDAVEDRPELDGMAVDGRQGGPRGAGYGSRSEDGVARRPADQAKVTAATIAHMSRDETFRHSPRARRHGDGTRVTDFEILVWACMAWLSPQAAMLPITLFFSDISHDIWIHRRPEGRLAVYFSATAGWESPLILRHFRDLVLFSKVRI